MRGVKAQVDKARKLFRDFHGRMPHDHELAELFVSKTVVVPVGRLHAISYIKDVDGKEQTFYHEFDETGQPVLMSSCDGLQLYIVAGQYALTARGIEG